MAERAPESPSRSTPGYWFVLAPAVALVVGLVLGGLVVWAGQDDSTAEAPLDDAAPTVATPTPTEAGEDTEIVVPSECLEAAETLQAATDTFGDLASALRDFRADELRDLLTELEQLEEEARDQAEACRQVELNSTSVPSPTA